MNRTSKILTTALALLSFVAAPMSVRAADTVYAGFDISGYVPEVFSMSARGLPGDLDLTPGATVNNRTLGLLHFKYNKGVSTLKITTSTASGKPEKGGSGAIFTSFDLNIKAGCTTTDDAKEAAFVEGTSGGYGGLTDNLADAGVNNAGLTALGHGIEEDCEVQGSWVVDNSSSLPLAGRYSMTITAQFVSQ